jgi:hypothetical protein
VFVTAVVIGAAVRIWRLLGRSWQEELSADSEVEL